MFKIDTNEKYFELHGHAKIGLKLKLGSTICYIKEVYEKKIAGRTTALIIYKNKIEKKVIGPIYGKYAYNVKTQEEVVLTQEELTEISTGKRVVSE